MRGPTTTTDHGRDLRGGSRVPGIAWRVAIVYAIVSIAWIFGSARLVEALVDEPSLEATIETAEEWAFVGVSALLLYGYVRALERHRSERDAATRASARSAELLRATIEASPRAIVVVDADGLVSLWSPGAERIFGRSADEATGRALTALGGDVAGFVEIVDRIRRGETPASTAASIRRPDGTEVAVDVAASRLRTDEAGPGGVVCVVGDVTARNEERAAIERSNRTLVAARAIADAVLHASDERTMLQRACSAVIEHTGHRFAWIGLTREEDRVIRPVAWSGEGAEFLRGTTIRWDDEGTGRGPTGTAVRSGRPVWIDDGSADARVEPVREAWERAGFRSAIALPLRVADGRVVGVLSLYSAEPGGFDGHEAELLQRLADDLAFGLVGLRAGRERELAIGALRESEERVRRTLESLSEGVIVVDETGNVRSANPTAVAMFGYDREELIGMPVDALVPERIRPVHAVHRMKYMRSPRTRSMGAGMDLHGRRKDGSEFPIEVGLSAVDTPDGRLVTAVVSDVTERRAAERIALEAETRFRRFVDAVEDYAIFTLDADGIVTHWNAGAERVNGFTEGEIVGRSFEVFYGEDDRRAGIPQLTLDEARAFGRHEIEGWRYRRDGSRFWGNVVTTSVRNDDGDVVGFVKIMRDLTERRRAEAEVERARTRLEILHDIDRAILGSASREEMADLVLEALFRLVPFDRGSVATYTPTSDRVRIVAVRQSEDLGPGVGAEFPVGDFDVAPDFRLLRNVDELGDVNQGFARMAASGLRSMMQTKLRLDGPSVGALVLFSRDREAFDDERVHEAVREVADQLSIAWRHSALREELAAHADELAVVAEHRQTLLRQLVTAQEDERARLARELHDGLGQTLTSLALFAAELELAQSSPESRERVREYRRLVEAAVGETRAMVRGLRPDELHGGIGPVIQGLVVRLSQEHGVPIDVQDATDRRRFDDVIESTCYRVVQEALTNVIRHAGASRASVVLAARDGWLVAVVEDDGRGFDPSVVPEGHFGVLGMQERAELAGGELDIESSPGTGTTVRLRLPALERPLPDAMGMVG